MRKPPAAVRALFATAVLLTLSASLAAQNLLPDGSFEEPKAVDRWGRVFAKWAGNLYTQPSRFEVGRVARTGKTSCQMICEKGGKIRLQSELLALEPGRYKLELYFRGLDIQMTPDHDLLDLTVGFDGKWYRLAQQGTFGWTPVTYVFEVKEKTDKFQLMVGLIGTGMLWVDDASLVKVDVAAALTEAPAVGREEKPVQPPAALAADAVRCKECGATNNRDWTSCWACGAEVKVAAKFTGPAIKVIADFEDGTVKPFLQHDVRVAGKNAPQGKFAVELYGREWAEIENIKGDWRGYDYLHIDFFNPQDDAVGIYIEIRDAQTRDYYSRVNFETVLPPGRSTVTIPTNFYTGEKARPYPPLHLDQITRICINTDKKPILFDNMRLEHLNLDEAVFDGLTALDFGTGDSPVMEGFTQVTPGSLYRPARGFGWQNAQLGQAADVLQPDALYEDFIFPQSGSFRIDVPAGKYHVVMNIDLPGSAYWGEVQTYAHRAVTANGRKVVDESMDFPGFMKKYYRNAHKEVLPGVDTFGEFVEKMCSPKEFDVDAADGKIELGFEGEGMAICLSSVMAWPVDRAPQGRRFQDWVTQRRRFQFESLYRQVLPKKTGAAPPAEGYVVFARHYMSPVNAFDGPAKGEGLTDAGLAVAAARGEEAALTFSVQPSGDLGKVDLDVPDLVGPGGAVLKAECLRPGWIDYRIVRMNMQGSMYMVSPKYWHPMPAPASPKVTRTFWLRITPPEGAPAGTYVGRVTLKPEKDKPRSFPLKVTVLPFALDPITDVAVGPWGCNIALPWNGPEAQAWNWTMYEKSLTAIRQAGATSFSGIPNVGVTFEGGKVLLKTDIADREMAIARKVGFSMLVSNYGCYGLGYNMYGNESGPDIAAAKRAGFDDMEAFIRTVMKTADDHAVAANWLPVAYCLCDEPSGDAARASAVNAALHAKVARELKRSTFVGATSLEGSDPKDPHYELVKALPIPSLNLHDEASLKLIKDSGNRLSFYNGGSRWCFGRYMRMLSDKHGLALRLIWHYYAGAGDPYYGLDSREDDYCWFNTDETQTMVPSVALLTNVTQGLNDYRYLATLKRLLKEKPGHPAAAEARKVYDEMVDLVPGKDRFADSVRVGEKARLWDEDREKISKAIVSLLVAQ